MVAIAKFINLIFSTIFYPLQYVSPSWGLLIASLLTGVVMLIIFRYTSNQQKIKWAKDKIKGHILEIRLYRDSPKVILKALGRILGYNGIYMRFALVPLIFIIIPVVLILVNLNFRYNFSGLSPGKTALVKVTLKNARNVDPNKLLQETSGVKIDTPALFIPSQNEIDWRIQIDSLGNHTLSFQVGEQVETKRIVVGDDPILIAPVRVGHSFWQIIMNPAEKPLPKDSIFEKIEVTYPARDNSLLGIHMHWLVIFFVLSLIFAFVLKGPMKVEI